MPYYYKLGKIPQKRHTQFRQPDGSLYKEELFSTIGFDSIYSNAYHINSPAKIKSISPKVEIVKIEEWDDAFPLQGLIGFFYPSYSYPYIKKQIIYHDNDTATETTTSQHAIIQAIYTVVYIGILYGISAYIAQWLKIN